MKRRLLALALVFGVSATALAQRTATPSEAAARPTTSTPAKDIVRVELVQHKVLKDDKGVEKLVDAGTVMPGDVLEYRVTYTNTSKQNVDGLVGELPLPQGLEYLPKTARPGAALVKAATKDGVYAAEPLVRPLPGGKSEQVPFNEYRSLRWQLGQLPAGGVTSVSARAKVETTVPVKVAPHASNSAPQAPPAAK